jgi:acyl-CoA hydrolase
MEDVKRIILLAPFIYNAFTDSNSFLVENNEKLTEVMYVVTEYGVADLMFKSVREQAQSLIDIADPDFRDQLTFEAKKHGLLS